jgi:selenocysteine lyase/cysteine desulfurase
VPGLTLYGPRDAERQVGVVSVNLDGWEPTDLGVALDQDFDIAVRTGLHCAPLAHRTIGTFPTGTVRLSPGYFTTLDDVDWVISALVLLAGQSRRGVGHCETDT